MHGELVKVRSTGPPVSSMGLIPAASRISLLTVWVTAPLRMPFTISCRKRRNRMLKHRKVVTLFQARYNTVSWNSAHGKCC